MRITSRQLRQIIREELLREAQTTGSTTSYDEDLPSGSVKTENPLMKALKSAAAVGHKGAVTTTMSTGDVELMGAAGDGRHFEAADYPEYEFFLDTYIKPERRVAYDKAFKDLAKSGSMGRHIRVPVKDINDGLASDYLLMGVASSGVGSAPRTEDSVSIQKVHDYRLYSVEETYKFLKEFITTPIKVYDYIEGKDPEGEGRLIYPAAEREKVEVPSQDKETTEWLARVSKTPLRPGASGADVKKAQELLVKELKKAAAKPMGTTGKALSELQSLLTQKKIEGGKDKPAELVQSLAGKIEASVPDGKFGPMTKAAVMVFQDYARLARVDGVIGKDTADALTRGVERVSLADQPEQTPENPPAESDVKDVTESLVIARWNRLAGLIKS